MSLSNEFLVGGLVIAAAFYLFIKKRRQYVETSEATSSKLIEQKKADSESDLKEVSGIGVKDSVKKSAKDEFLANIHRFSPLLNSLLDGSYNSDIWTDEIIDINNDDLINYWKKVYKNVDSIIRMLAMWGIKNETCTSFIGIESYNELYNVSNQEKIVPGEKYKVHKACWILTNNATGHKTVLIKGEASHE